METNPIQTIWSLYVIRCANKSLYCGITVDVERRFSEHQAMGKKTAKYLRGKGPLEIVFSTEVGNRSQASKAEMLFKSFSKSQKEDIVIRKEFKLAFLDECDDAKLDLR